MREAMDHAHLQRVVNRIRAGLIVIKARRIGNLQIGLRFELAGAERRAVRRAQQIESVPFVPV